MCIIHNRIQHELRTIGNARSVIKRAEQRLRFLFDALQSQDAVAANRQDAPACASTAEETEARAAQAVRQAGYEPIGQIGVTGPVRLNDSDLLADAPAQAEDMRAIERTASGGYRCTLRRGKSKRRLIPEVFPTLSDARAARDALERHLKMVIPRGRKRPA